LDGYKHLFLFLFDYIIHIFDLGGA